MADALALFVAVLVCALPGCLVLAALGVRQPSMYVALAVPVSVATAAVCAVAAAVVGLDFGVGLVLAVVFLAAIVGAARLIHECRRPGLCRTRKNRRHKLPYLLGSILTLFGCGVGVWTWLRALGGSFSTVPQEHDTIIHLLLTSYISRSGSGAPWQVLPLDVMTGQPVEFYPAGMHLLAALTADIIGDSVVALNAVSIVLLAISLSISAASLTFAAARQLQLSVIIAATSAGVAALAASSLYRPTFQLAHDGGALPNAAALAMTPGVVAAFLMLSAASKQAAVGVGLACVGIVWVHPSAAVSVGVTVLAWWCGDLVTRRGRSALRQLLMPLGVVAVIAGTLLVPLLWASAAAAESTEAFPADIPPVGLSGAVGSTLGLAYGGYLDPERVTGQLWAAVLTLLGIAVILILRRGFGIVTAWSAWVAITIAYFLSPSSGLETIVTGYFYKAMVRVWSHVSILVPPLVGIALAVLAALIAIAIKRSWAQARVLRSPPITLITAAIAAVMFAGYAVGPTEAYSEKNSTALASRYADPAFLRVGPDDRAAADWLANKIGPGERVLNSANDGSIILYVEYGIPIVNVSTLGVSDLPYTFMLLEMFNQYPDDADIRKLLRDLQVRWVYVDSAAPTIGAARSPEGWAGDSFSVAPGLSNLDGLPGLDEVFESGTVSIYRLNLDVTESVDQTN